MTHAWSLALGMQAKGHSNASLNDTAKLSEHSHCTWHISRLNPGSQAKRGSKETSCKTFLLDLHSRLRPPPCKPPTPHQHVQNQAHRVQREQDQRRRPQQRHDHILRTSPLPDLEPLPARIQPAAKLLKREGVFRVGVPACAVVAAASTGDRGRGRAGAGPGARGAAAASTCGRGVRLAGEGRC